MSIRIHWSLFGLAVFLLVGCRTAAPTSTPAPLPTAVPISNDLGQIIASQPGPVWVLLSGVDEHGLIIEHEVTLLQAAAADAEPGPQVHTGIPAAVQEIRQTGPQNLRRFYRVETVTGETGWISDYYIRRVAYLFNEQGETVPLYASPNDIPLTQVSNVTPVIIRQPADSQWWIVQLVETDTVGWVEAAYVKESPEPEFLLNQHQHP